MRRLPDGSDRLAAPGGPSTGRYLHTSAHVSTPVPEARAEPAAPAPQAPPGSGSQPPPAQAPAAAPPASSRSASEAVHPQAVPHVHSEPPA
eukprot:7846346-Alexandrium_andersonii.AAC.1